MTVAMRRTGLNMSFTCCLGPTRKPELKSQTQSRQLAIHTSLRAPYEAPDLPAERDDVAQAVGDAELGAVIGARNEGEGRLATTNQNAR